MKNIFTLTLCLFWVLNTALAQNNTLPPGVRVAPSKVAGKANTLESLKEDFQKSQLRIESDCEKQKQSSLVAYGRALETVLQALKTKGDLDGVLYLKKEAERFKAEPTVLEPGGEGRPALLEKAITDYAEAIRKADSSKAERCNALGKQYLAQLDELTKQLVMADKIEDAKKVREEADRITTEVVSMTDPTSNKSPEQLTDSMLKQLKQKPSIQVEAMESDGPPQIVYLGSTPAKGVRFLDWDGQSWDNDISKSFTIRNTSKGSQVSCKVKGGYEQKLVLFTEESPTAVAMVISLTLEKGLVEIGTRPKNLAPTGTGASNVFPVGKRVDAEFWIEGNRAQLTVNGVDVALDNASCTDNFGYFSLLPSAETTFVIHSLKFVPLAERDQTINRQKR